MVRGRSGAIRHAHPSVTIVVPAFNSRAFIARALRSACSQSFEDWELVVVDDGSTDDTLMVLRPHLADPRVLAITLPENQGLGAALNAGIDATSAPLIAYLPADDVWDRCHLELLDAALDEDAVLACSGVRHHDGLTSPEAPDGYALQLVQVMHRRTGDRWVERPVLESDDLARLMWSRLRARGAFRAHGVVTCQWVEHPGQRHRLMRESLGGGLNVFRRHYGVTHPVRFHSTDSGVQDEPGLYERWRRMSFEAAPDGLRILLVGELAYNPERMLCLLERGHTLAGLWTDDGTGDQTVGPLPFGHVADLPRDGWREAARMFRPDVVYALLNWRAVPLAHAVMRANLGVPFVFHFKEAPTHCMRLGTWPLLVDLCMQADGLVLSTALEREWLDLAVPGGLDPGRTLVLDGDLPKREWFQRRPSSRLSASDGSPHTVVLGRPLGLDAGVLVELAARGVHTHLYGLIDGQGPTGAWRQWLGDALARAPEHVHVHPRVDQRSWVRELSKYDAGWLHLVRSSNGGELARATWDDLNAPARIPPYLAAGLPLLQPLSRGCRVHTQAFIEDTGAGILFEDLTDLADRLHDACVLDRAREAAWRCRLDACFDSHADRLLTLFHQVVDERRAA